MSQGIQSSNLETLVGGLMVTWKLGKILWDGFDASKVDPEIVPIVKAASMVENDTGDYCKYLKNFCRQRAHAKRDRARDGRGSAAWQGARIMGGTRGSGIRL